MEQFFLKLYEAFDAAGPGFDDAGLPRIATIDRYRGQPLNPEAFEYYPLPAIFVGRKITWDDKTGLLSLDFHIETETTGEMGKLYTSHPEALKYFRFINKVREVLDSFTTEFTSTLKRGTDTEVDTGVTIYEILNYSCNYYDDIGDEDKYTESEDDDLDLDGGLVRLLG